MISHDFPGFRGSGSYPVISNLTRSEQCIVMVMRQRNLRIFSLCEVHVSHVPVDYAGLDFTRGTCALDHKALWGRTTHCAPPGADSVARRVRSAARLRSSESGSIATRWRIVRSPP